MQHMVYFGTESGNSEMIAEDIAVKLDAPPPFDLHHVNPAELDPLLIHVIVCSTYGEGEIPASAQPFADRLERERPDLSGVRYAMFGLGDSGYADSYSKGSERLAALLDARGAQRIGEYGRHDAARFDDASTTALAWVRDLLATPIAA